MLLISPESTSRNRPSFKMLFWLIPYLVSYNVSETGDWKYGPEYVFETIIFNNVTVPTNEVHNNLFMYINCRPMNPSLIQCRITTATMLNYEVSGSLFTKQPQRTEKLEMQNVVFQVEFDEEGVSNVWFQNTNNSDTLNKIRAVIGTINTGISLTGKKFGTYRSLEKSTLGICNTSFNISKKRWSEQEEEAESGYKIKGYKFDVPSLGARSDDETIVIEKYRNLNECSGTEEKEGIQDSKEGKSEKFITHSQSRFFLGRRSFIAQTDNLGPVKLAFGKQGTVEMKSGQMIRVRLASIKPATVELKNTNNLKNLGAGFEPGTPWPGQNFE